MRLDQGLGKNFLVFSSPKKRKQNFTRKKFQSPKNPIEVS